MPPDMQQVLFYPVDDTFRPANLGLPIVLIAIPFLSFLLIWGTIFAAGCIAIATTERLLGRHKYTDKILTFLKNIQQKNVTN